MSKKFSYRRDNSRLNVFRLFGFFVLHRPIFVIKDDELAKRIMIEHFDCFANFAGSEMTGVADEIIRKSLSCLEGDEWHRMRNTL